jgi:F-type H+-transporting ATPase subunit g
MELSKLVFQGQKMSPPPVATFQSYYQKLVKSVRNPGALFTQVSKSTNSATPASVLNSVRNTNSSQMIAGGVIAAEVLGFFTVGEMIGRLKVVGYRGDTGAHH